MTKKEEVDTRRAAEILGLSYQCLCGWRYRGKGPRYSRVGGRIRYSVDDLAEYLEGCVVEPGECEEIA